MAKQVIFRRGTTAQHASFTGANGEITVDTVKHVAVIHDGVTAGGWPQANAAQISATITALTANAGNQATSITALIANAAAQSTAIASLQANAASQQISINAFTLASNATAILANIAATNANVAAANVNINLLFGNATVQSEAITRANANILALQSSVANIPNLQSITGSVRPSANVAYDLGSPTKRWRDLYLSGNSIYLGASVVSVGSDGRVVLPGLSVTAGKAVSIVGQPGEAEYPDVPVIIDQATYYLANPAHANQRGDFIPAVYAPIMSGNLISGVSIVSPGYYTTNIEQWSAFNEDSMWALPAGTARNWTDLWSAIYQIEYVGNEPYGGIPFGVVSSTDTQTATSGSSVIGGSLTLGGNLVPTQANVSTLGTPAMPFSHVYVGAGSITVGNIVFTEVGVQAAGGGTFPEYTFGNVRLTSDGIVIGSNAENPIYLSLDAQGNPQFRMGETAIELDASGNFVFPGVSETQDDVYQIVDIAYQGGANIALDPNAPLNSQVAYLDKLTWRESIAQDLPFDIVDLGNPWFVYKPFNNVPTSPISVDYIAYQNGSLEFAYYDANKVYTYTAAQANIAGGNIMVTTTLTEYAPGQYQSSSDPNDWFEVNWAPVFAKGKTAGNVNFNSGNVEVWNNIGVASVPGTITEAIDSLANIIAVTNATTAPFEPANPIHWTANVSTIGDALNQLAERIYNLENP